MKTKKTFIAKLNIFILTVLLILSLIPLALTVITSIVPEGDLFNITKEVELSDFELPPFFLTKKIFPIESEKFDTVDGDNNSGKVLQLDTKDCVTGIMVNIGDVDLNKIKEFTFSLNTSQKIKTFYLGFKDVQGMQEFLPAELTYVSGKWNNAIVHVPVFLAHPQKDGLKAKVLFTVEGKGKQTVERFLNEFKSKRGKPEKVLGVTSDLICRELALPKATIM